MIPLLNCQKTVTMCPFV